MKQSKNYLRYIFFIFQLLVSLSLLSSCNSGEARNEISKKNKTSVSDFSPNELEQLAKEDEKNDSIRNTLSESASSYVNHLYYALVPYLEDPESVTRIKKEDNSEPRVAEIFIANYRKWNLENYRKANDLDGATKHLEEIFEAGQAARQELLDKGITKVINNVYTLTVLDSSVAFYDIKNQSITVLDASAKKKYTKQLDMSSIRPIYKPMKVTSEPKIHMDVILATVKNLSPDTQDYFGRVLGSIEGPNSHPEKIEEIVLARSRIEPFVLFLNLEDHRNLGQYRYFVSRKIKRAPYDEKTLLKKIDEYEKKGFKQAKKAQEELINAGVIEIIAKEHGHRGGNVTIYNLQNNSITTKDEETGKEYIGHIDWEEAQWYIW